jgi:two-component system phosphate regulon sensor histidine kinase PhoR
LKTDSTYNEKEELESLRLELKEIKFQLEEATDTLEAIRSGEVDALIVKTESGHQLYALKNADQSYRIFIEQMTEGAVTLNREGNIVYSNSRFAQLVGLSLEKIIGKSFSSFLANDCTLACKDLLVKAWSDDAKGEINIISTEGYQVPVLLSLKKLQLNEGPSLSIILTDLSSQKKIQQLLKVQNEQLEKAHLNLELMVMERTRELEQSILDKTIVEKELRSNQDRLTRILETMAEGVAIMDTEGKLTYANPMAQKILGLKQNNDAEKTYDDPKWNNYTIDGLPLARHQHPMFIAINTGELLFDFEIAVQPEKEERFYISINAAPIRDDDGTIISAIGTFMDVTNRRKTIQQKDDFISIASHELKTPVTTLKASLQVLERMQREPNPGVLSKMIQQANKSMHKISGLIADLLNATKITEGHLQINRTPFKIVPLLDNCCGHVRAEGRYELIVTGDQDLTVLADEHRIDQVVVNLVNNAVKYAPESKQIFLTAEKSGKMVKVSIKDNGPGISEDKLPYLFDRYFRVDTQGTQYSGLGLGLYICSEIIKKHHGEIGVESQPGKGCTFWFTLPVTGG